MRPVVSVVIPTFNQANLLREALASVYGQEGIGEVFDLEVIVVDDASSDQTPHVVSAYPGTRYIRFETNSGGPAAPRNAGIRASSGAYIAFLDHDDLWLPTRLKAQVPVMESRKDVGMVYSQIALRSKTAKPWPEAQDAPSGMVFRDMLLRYFTHTITLLIRKDVFEKVGYFDETFLACDDWDMWIRIAFYFPILFVPECVAIHRPLTDGIVRRRLLDGTVPREQVRVIEKALASMPESEERRALDEEARACIDIQQAEALATVRRNDEAMESLHRGLRAQKLAPSDPRVKRAIDAVAWVTARDSDRPIAAVTELRRQVREAIGSPAEGLKRGWRRITADMWASAALGLITGKRKRFGSAFQALLLAISADPSTRFGSTCISLTRAFLRQLRTSVAKLARPSMAPQTFGPPLNRGGIAMVVRIGSRLLLAMIGIFFALGLAEGALRTADIAPRREIRRQFWYRQVETHELFGWFHTPNTRFVYRTPLVDFRNPVKISSTGLREREYSYQKATGDFRLLITGDSFTASLEVPLEQTWHEIVEEKLNAEGGDRSRRRTEVIAAGVQAWGTDQQLLYYLHEGYRYEPDVIILQFYQNDVFENDPDVARLTTGGSLGGKPRFVQDGDRLELRDFPYRGEGFAEDAGRSSTIVGQIRVELRKKFHVYRFIRSVVNSRKVGKARVSSLCYRSADETPYELTVYAPTYPPEFTVAWELTLRLIRELRMEAEKQGKRFAVIHIPDRRQVSREEWEATLECWPAAKAARWDLNKPNRLLGDFLRMEGIPYLDLTPGLREHTVRTGRSPYWELDWHFNPEGHQVVSRVVYEWLVRERLVPFGQ